MLLRPLSLLFTLLLVCTGASGTAPGAPKAFVQAFYDWYVPLAAKGRGVPASDYVLRKRASAFDPGLVAAIREDSAAQAQVMDEIVGLDGDAFLMSQDIADRYVLGPATRKDGGFRVPLYAVWNGRKDAKPDVIAEVRLVKGRWVFVDFHDNAGSSLREVLAQLKADREQPPR
jgi:hypothetical protein